jgi:hypothetical protein
MSASPSPEAAHGVWQFSSSSPVVSLDFIKISNAGIGTRIRQALLLGLTFFKAITSGDVQEIRVSETAFAFVKQTRS